MSENTIKATEPLDQVDITNLGVVIKDAFRFASLTVVYVAVAGLSLSSMAEVSPVWPLSGLAIAALSLRGLRLWPAITVDAFAANLFFAAPPCWWRPGSQSATPWKPHWAPWCCGV